MSFPDTKKTDISYVTESGPNSEAVKTAPAASPAISRHKYCPKCRKEIPLDSAKCPYCGKRWTGRDIEIHPGWGIVTLILGLALIGFAPILAIPFLAATICFAVKGMTDKKKKKVLPAAAVIPLRPQEEQNHDAEVQAAAQPVPDTVSEDSQDDAEPDEVIESESDGGAVIVKTYKATGMNDYMDNIMHLATANPGYTMSKTDIIDFGITDERIWKYDFYARVTELVPEPDNPHDPMAIKVVLDGEHVGYIKAGSCSHLLKVIHEGRIRSISCKIGGGPYKEVREENNGATSESVYTVAHGETEIFLRLTIREEQ